MKYYILIALLLFSFSLSAQKNTGRKEIKKGNKAYQTQKYEQAAADYQAAIQANPSSEVANYNLGNTLYRQKKWDESIQQQQHYLMLEKRDPVKMASAWHNMGNAFFQKKELQKALEAYKMALRLNPNDDETRYNMAVTQKIIQDRKQENQDKEQNKDQDKQDQEQEQKENQDKQNQQDQNKDQEKKPEQQKEPEQMSRENARQILQAIEQDEKETQERVKQIKAQERQQKAENNRRQDKDW